MSRGEKVELKLDQHGANQVMEQQKLWEHTAKQLGKGTVKHKYQQSRMRARLAPERWESKRAQPTALPGSVLSSPETQQDGTACANQVKDN